ICSLRVVRKGLVEEVGLKTGKRGLGGADNAVFVDGDENRYARQFKEVDRIVQDRPVEALPLGEQTASLGMLLLDDAQEHELALFDPACGSFVPDRHVLTAARSPRGEMNEQHFLAAKV